MTHYYSYYRLPNGDVFRISIEPDSDAESPREATNVTVMQTWESNYETPDLGTDLGLPFVHGEDGISMRRLHRWVNLFGKAHGILAVAGLYRNSYDYYGTLSSSGYGTLSSSGDGVIGVIAITAHSWETCMGDTQPTPSLLIECMEQDIAAYNRWAEGEYVGYVVEHRRIWTLKDHPNITRSTWEEIDSCWGIDDRGYALFEALHCLPDNCVEIS